MTVAPSLLAEYLEHLQARLRHQSNTPTPRDEESDLATLPDSVSDLCSTQPHDCLELILAALRETTSPHIVQAIGDGLLENLLNEHSQEIHDQTVALLQTDQQFRFAFACGNFASVDPSLVDEWLTTLRDLGTTKQAERKKLWRRRD